MRYPIYSRLIRRRSMLLAAAFAALFLVASDPSGADVQAGIDAARSGNFNMAHADFLREAKLGNPDAQTLLGELYHKGRGVEQSYLEPAAWYRRAAARGHAVHAG